MICPRLFRICLWFGLTAFAFGVEPPTLTFPANQATNLPTDLTLTWEEGTNYVADSGFEKNSGKWARNPLWRFTTDATAAYDGTHFAEIPVQPNNLGARGAASVFQSVILPQKGSNARLRWRDYHSSTGLPETRPRFQVHVFIYRTETDFLIHDVACGEGSVARWNEHELDVSEFFGKSFRLFFSVTNQFGSPRTCEARVDDVHLEVTPEASVEYKVYLDPTANPENDQLLGPTTDTSWNLSGLAPGSTHYWKISQMTDGVQAFSPLFQFTVGGGLPVEAPPLLAELSGGQLHLHATTQPDGFYQFEHTDAPDSDAWQPIGEEITGDGAETSLDVPLDAEAQFFRIRVMR